MSEPRSTRLGAFLLNATGATVTMFTVPPGRRLLLRALNLMKPAVGAATVQWEFVPAPPLVGNFELALQSLGTAAGWTHSEVHLVLEENEALLARAVSTLTTIKLTAMGFVFTL